jgi:hypothetical protein
MARPAAYLRLAPTVPRFRPTGGDLFRLASNDLSSGKAATNLRLASAPSFGSAGSTSGLRRLLFLPPGWLNIRFASAASPSGFTGREPLNFR